MNRLLCKQMRLRSRRERCSLGASSLGAYPDVWSEGAEGAFVLGFADPGLLRREVENAFNASARTNVVTVTRLTCNDMRGQEEGEQIRGQTDQAADTDVFSTNTRHNDRTSLIRTTR